MSFFGFGEISFDKGAVTNSPLGSLFTNQFSTSTLRYPSDLCSADKNHYMVIYIRQQRNTQVQGLTQTDSYINTGSIPSGIANALPNKVSEVGTEILSKVNGLMSQVDSMVGESIKGVTSALSAGGSNIVAGISDIFFKGPTTLTGASDEAAKLIEGSIKQASGSSINFLKTSLTTDAIALYMPDTLMYDYSQSYNEEAIGNELGGQAIAAGRSVIDEEKRGGAAGRNWAVTKSAMRTAEKSVMSGAGEVIGSGTAKLGAAAIMGSVTNPMLEMIYSSPNFRNFQFEFMFYPRDENEGLEVQRIIERLRFHQAPELEQGSQGFLVPPSEFDIRMYYNGQINPNIPTIATCVLKNISVNYAPQGFSAYEVPGSPNKLGGTGMPVAIQLTLQFTEITYLTKADFWQKPSLVAR
ncbi:hypothetical protein M0R04_04160 [Candidatus Dojkabacteria bacterium]|jgi:hypothetical protein|nr:hypothetical protein [Candidatus Dojkabacteria bacterium]